MESEKLSVAFIRTTSGGLTGTSKMILRLVDGIGDDFESATVFGTAVESVFMLIVLAYVLAILDADVRPDPDIFTILAAR